MINKLSSDWIKNNAENFDAGMRFYIDPRGIEYPYISGTPSYIVVSGAYNAPGRYRLGSTLTYIFSPGVSFSAEVMVENISSGTSLFNILRLLGGYTVTLRHNAAGTYSLVMVGGSTVTLTGGVTQPLQRIGFTMTYGGAAALYVDGVSVATGTAPALTTHPTTLELSGSAAAPLSYVRFFNGYAATATNHSTAFHGVGNEEIYFTFNKTAYGRTRCNLDRGGVDKLVTEYSIEKPVGYRASSASISLNNPTGEFSADQFATYAPEVGSYNGTSAQNYLARRVGLEIETVAPTAALYPSDTLYPSNTLYPLGCDYILEPLFRGWISRGAFARSTSVGDMSIVSVTAEDAIPDIGRKRARRSYVWDSYYLSRATPASNSVFHEIAWLATKRYITNYCTNSCFENTTIGNTWITNGTLIRDTTAVLQGTYCGKFTGTDKTVSTVVSFANTDDELTVGDKFTAGIYVYSASAINGKIKCEEFEGTTSRGSTEVSFTHDGKGWNKVSASHTVTNSASNRMSLVLTSVGAWSNVPIDCAMIKRGSDVDYILLNSNDGTSGVSASTLSTTGSYEWIGIDADDVSYIHPWAWIQKGDSIIENLQEIAASVCARVFSVDSSGVLVLRAGVGGTLPSAIGNIAKASSIMGEVISGANRIIVSGTQIEKRTQEENVWMACVSSLAKSSGDTGSQFSRTVADGETIPDFTKDGVTVFEALYSEMKAV